MDCSSWLGEWPPGREAFESSHMGVITGRHHQPFLEEKRLNNCSADGTKIVQKWGVNQDACSYSGALH